MSRIRSDIANNAPVWLGAYLSDGGSTDCDSGFFGNERGPGPVMFLDAAFGVCILCSVSHHAYVNGC